MRGTERGHKLMRHKIHLGVNKPHVKKEIRISPKKFTITDSILNKPKNLTKNIKDKYIFLIANRQQIYRIGFLITQKRQRCLLSRSCLWVRLATGPRALSRDTW